MSDFLEAATEIQDWLSGLQIKQQGLSAEIRNGDLLFSFEHPTRGHLDVTTRLPEDSIFRSEGVAFEKDASSPDARVGVYDYGGIWDPVDERVMGEHYSTSHFAYLTALLFSESQEEGFLDQIRQAIEFHAHTSPDEYTFSEWMYHWDFQNYAMLGCYELMQSSLESDTLDSLRHSILNGQTNGRNKLTNWGGMRALAYLKRRDLFGRPLDIVRYRWNLRTMLGGEQPFGCFDDERDVSRPIQYHAFTVALIHRIYMATGDQKQAQKFIMGAEFLNQFIDPDGDFNYWGRGQEQIFGYGAAIYVMMAAAKLTGEKCFERQAFLLFDFLAKFQTDGHFPLVLNCHKDEERFGWYDYHHTTVYNAFLGVWLALSHKIVDKQQKPVSMALGQPGTKKPAFAFLRSEDVFVAIGGGLTQYASEPGLSPSHIWMKDVGWLFSCPGGPTPDAFGKFFPEENISLNFFAPVAFDASGEILSPARRKGIIEKHAYDVIECTLDYGVFCVSRRVTLRSRGIEISDKIAFSQDRIYKEFRFFNFPVIVDKFAIDVDGEKLFLRCDDGQVRVRCNIHNKALGFEKLETIRTAKGLASIFAKRVGNCEFERGAEIQVQTVFEVIGVRTVAENQSEVVEHIA